MEVSIRLSARAALSWAGSRPASQGETARDPGLQQDRGQQGRAPPGGDCVCPTLSQAPQCRPSEGPRRRGGGPWPQAAQGSTAEAACDGERSRTILDPVQPRARSQRAIPATTGRPVQRPGGDLPGEQHLGAEARRRGRWAEGPLGAWERVWQILQRERVIYPSPVAIGARLASEAAASVPSGPSAVDPDKARQRAVRASAPSPARRRDVPGSSASTLASARCCCCWTPAPGRAVRAFPRRALRPREPEASCDHI